MTGPTMRWLGLCWMLVASVGCAETTDGSPDGDGAPEDAGWPPRSAQEPACKARWPEAPASDQPHWLAFKDQEDLRVIDIADPRSEPITVSSHADTGETVHDQHIQWSPDGRWLAFATFYAQGGMALYVVEMTSDVPGLPRLVAGSPDVFLVIDELSWSPASDQLAYVVTENEVVDQRPVALMLAAMAEEQPITLSDSYLHGTLRWSPDGSKLLLQTPSSRLLFGLEDPLQRTVLPPDSEGREEKASWSPDSRYVVTFDEALRAWDTQADPQEVTVLSPNRAPELSITSLAWSDDARFLVVQENTGGPLSVFDMQQTAPAAAAIRLTPEHGATRFGGYSLHQGFRSSDFGFEPGGHRIVYPARTGWLTIDLTTAEIDPRPIAGLNAMLLGFSSAHELLWRDAEGIHSTSLDRRSDRVILGSGSFYTGVDFEYASELSAGIAPSGDRFLLTSTGSALHLMMIDDCDALLATFAYPETWSGVFTPGGYSWAWLNDGSGVVQQTYLKADDAVDSRARIELVRPAGDELVVRTLLETAAYDQVVPFTWREQPIGL